jgi:hypothetical protein
MADGDVSTWSNDRLHQQTAFIVACLDKLPSLSAVTPEGVALITALLRRSVVVSRELETMRARVSMLQLENDAYQAAPLALPTPSAAH